MVSTETVAGGTAKDEEQDEERKRLQFSEKYLVDIYYDFLDCRPFSGNDFIAKESMIQLLCLHAWVATILVWLVQRDTCHRYRQKV